MAPREPTKRSTKSRKRPANHDEGEEDADGSNAAPAIQVCHSPLNLLRDNRRWQCRWCMEAGEKCITLSSGACQRCSSRKQKCNLMPLNPTTGKTDCRSLSAAELREFRIKQTNNSRAEIEKGKQRAGDLPDAGNPEDSGPVPSPSAGLSALGLLTLESGGSSAGNTPSDSPAVPSRPSVMERPPQALPSAPTARRTSRRKAGI